jgi:hypothetical protein
MARGNILVVLKERSRQHMSVNSYPFHQSSLRHEQSPILFRKTCAVHFMILRNSSPAPVMDWRIGDFEKRDRHNKAHCCLFRKKNKSAIRCHIYDFWLLPRRVVARKKRWRGICTRSAAWRESRFMSVKKSNLGIICRCFEKTQHRSLMHPLSMPL